MNTIFQPSVLASGCPQSTSHHDAFMPDLCDVGDVAASFPPCFTRQETEGGNHCKLFLSLCFCSYTEVQIHDNVSEAALTTSSCSNRVGQSYFFSCGVTLSGKG